MSVPDDRVHDRGSAPVDPDGAYVLYWCTVQRRTRRNFALQRALERARELDRPLLVLEALSASYRWASDRFHAFAVEGMRDAAAAYEAAGIAYHPYVEPEPGAGKGLVAELAGSAALVVTDHWPCFHHPRWVAAVAERSPVRVEAVDSCGLLPVASAGKAFARAVDFRRHLQKHGLPHLTTLPLAEPLDGHDTAELDELPRALRERCPASDLDAFDPAELPIDHDVAPVPHRPGGARAAAERLDAFLDGRLARYLERNQPDADAASGLSPYLHWGHLSAHDVFARIVERDGWDPEDSASADAKGQREGWWGVSPEAEAFLDELVTWRELCLNTAQERPDDYDGYDSLPDFAKRTLAEHEADDRPYVYDLAEFEEARTHDDLWNAAQNQLRRDGTIHNYLRMLWGKKVLNWTRTPREALAFMIELNDKYALDGRDPNSYGGILWVLGRYDRAWGPERPVFGKVRTMTSKNTARKLRVREYVEEYASADA